MRKLLARYERWRGARQLHRWRWRPTGSPGCSAFPAGCRARSAGSAWAAVQRLPPLKHWFMDEARGVSRRAARAAARASSRLRRATGLGCSTAVAGPVAQAARLEHRGGLDQVERALRRGVAPRHRRSSRRRRPAGQHLDLGDRLLDPAAFERTAARARAGRAAAGEGVDLAADRRTGSADFVAATRPERRPARGASRSAGASPSSRASSTSSVTGSRAKSITVATALGCASPKRSLSWSPR